MSCHSNPLAEFLQATFTPPSIMQGRDLPLELRWSLDNGTLINILFVKFFVRIGPHWLLFEGQLTGHEFSLKLADFFAPEHTWNLELLSFEIYPNILNLIWSVLIPLYSQLQILLFEISLLVFAPPPESRRVFYCLGL